MLIHVRPKDKALVRTVIHHANLMMDELTPGQIYSIEDILGEDYWAATKGSHRALGRAFSFVVGDRPTPFTPKGLTKQRHNAYLFNPQSK